MDDYDGICGKEENDGKEFQNGRKKRILGRREYSNEINEFRKGRNIRMDVILEWTDMTEGIWVQKERGATQC